MTTGLSGALGTGRDPFLERMVVRVLRIGVLTSMAIISIGIVVSLSGTGSRRSERRSIPGLRHGSLHPAGFEAPHSVAGVLGGSLHGSGTAIVMLGLLLLILTPLARVAVSAISFGVERDRRFVLITLFVLAVLTSSFAIGA